MRVSVFAVALCLALAVALQAQSLGDLAKKEKERREAIGQVRVITGEEAAQYSTGQPEEPAAAESAPPAEKEAATGAAADPDEPVDFEGRPESFWRKTMAEARLEVKDLERERDTLILKINQLQDQFYKQSDGFHRESIQRELQKSYYLQDLNKENLAKAKDALEDLEKEARKSGALPGWIGN
ncbi:MAG: hypothetical protein JXP48_06285 [Acidobacteria bacterium]|nr:hypothetical protein [Acidobacteriota bacterium]